MEGVRSAKRRNEEEREQREEIRWGGEAVHLASGEPAGLSPCHPVQGCQGQSSAQLPREGGVFWSGLRSS